MDSLWQHIVIAVMVVVAAIYLAVRWRQVRRNRGKGPCGSCKCPLTQVHDLTARPGASTTEQRGPNDVGEDSDTSS